MAPRDFSGKWKLIRSENFEQFLEKMGAPWVARKMAAASSPTVEIQQDGDNFATKTSSAVFTREAKWTVGEESVQDHNGTKFKSLATWDGEKLVQKEEPLEQGKGKPQTHIREINSDGELVMTMHVEELVCLRVFKKLD